MKMHPIAHSPHQHLKVVLLSPGGHWRLPCGELCNVRACECALCVCEQACTCVLMNTRVHLCDMHVHVCYVFMYACIFVVIAKCTKWAKSIINLKGRASLKFQQSTWLHGLAIISM